MRQAASASPPSYESAGAWTVDRAVRALATACARESRAVPAVVALTLTPQHLLLHLTSPDESAPPAWSVADEGRTWRIDIGQVQSAPIDRGIPEPFPRLVSLGVSGTGRILLNLAAADGVISVEGDATRAYGLVQTWASRLATSPWSGGVRVVQVGFPSDESVVSLAEAASSLNDPGGGVLILAEPPRNRDLEYVTWLAEERHRGWSIVVLGADDARWRLTVDASGTVESGLLDEPVRLRG
jgi:hypothetical protein